MIKLEVPEGERIWTEAIKLNARTKCRRVRGCEQK
jgi:hypothetical protein